MLEGGETNIQGSATNMGGRKRKKDLEWNSPGKWNSLPGNMLGRGPRKNMWGEKLKYVGGRQKMKIK